MDIQHFSAGPHPHPYPNSPFTKKILFQEPGRVVFVLTFDPGQQLPVHKHPGACLYATLLEGAGTVYADGQGVEIAHGQAIRVSGEEEFSYRSREHSKSVLYVTLIQS
ncbi:hypothetical protein AWM70_07130 [Paenibacillus yonginensis]|uniref:Cupin type-2 domain-containing protein n=1 Tax=Paenibacillus yonginensis TaxID=1462996 RepID=A0A1B1MYW9_9BACL|nr:cupin domain-containing protein [Paenibacillus yonginensis]ANS74382.1 hypothetical protein AWM70_07130 [Paenibacillus yonginensis]